MEPLVINTRTDTRLDRLARVHRSALSMRGVKAEWVESQLAKYQEMSALLQIFHVKRQDLEASREWSAEGKAKRAQALAQDTAAQLDRFTAAIAGYEQHIASLTRQAKGEKPPSELAQVLRYLQCQEIRQAFAGKSAIEVQVAYERALEAGELLMVEALEGAPLPLLSPETRVKGQARREALALGDYAQEVEHLTLLRDAMSEALAAARAELEAAGLPSDRPRFTYPGGTPAI